jgi:acyl carrier protein
MTDQTQEQTTEWTRAEVRTALGQILEDCLGVRAAEVVPSASLVRDLGAESIDFLDLGFKIQQTFGVKLRTTEIRDRIVDWGMLVLPTLADLLTARYGKPVTPDELRPLEGSGIDGMLTHLRATSGIPADGGAAGEVAQELLQRLTTGFAALGFEVSDGDRQDLQTIMRTDLGVRRLTEKTLDLLTVEALGNFICAKLGPRLRTP